MDMEAGQVDADLGGHVYKQRVSRRGAGKSGGFRVILLLRWESHCIFVHGYAKSDKSSLSFREVAVYRLLATRLLKMEELVKLIENGKVSEVHCNGETISD